MAYHALAEDRINSKLTNQKVVNIYLRTWKTCNNKPEKTGDLAKEFRVSDAVISNIKWKRSYISVTDIIDEELKKQKG